MSILSTLRPLSSRVQDTLWWILAYLSAPVQMQMTFNDLNDDCLLLLLLELLSLPQLLQLRAVSRRLCYLIERYRLPKYQTLLYGYSKGEKEAREANSADQSVLLHVSTHLYAYSEFNLKRRLSLCDLCDLSFVSPPRLIFPLKRLVFPLSLPSLLPGLASLTATRFLVNKGVPLSEEASQVNRIMAHYLRSSWTETLVSLHLYIHVPTRPQPETEFWGLLGDLSILKYLSIEFSHFAQDYFSSSFLPDSLSVLGRLTSFSLSNYGGPNIPLLLSQLADNLTYLSLWDIACSVEECTAFFKSKPTYSRTLKTLEILLHGPVNWAFDWRIFTMTAQHLPSLERAVLNFVSLDADLVPFFADLNRLKHMREFSRVALFLSQFSAFRVRPNPGTLPRLTSIRRLSIHLFSHDTQMEDSELTGFVLPLLATVFCNLDFLDIAFSLMKPNGEYSEPHSIQLLAQASQVFKGLHYCWATVFL